MPKTKPKDKKPGKQVAKKRKLNLTVEQRKKRSDEMKKRRAEGKVGGAEFGKLGGRPKKKRAAEIAAEVAADHGKEMAQVFLDAMDEANPNSIRMKAAEGLYKIEEKEARLQMDEDEHLAKMGRDELLAALTGMFVGNPMLMEMFRAAADGADEDPAPSELPEGDDDKVLEGELVGED